MSAAGRIEKGDLVSMYVPDRRWWRRLLYWLLRCDPPDRLRYYRISSVVDNSMSIEDVT